MKIASVLFLSFLYLSAQTHGRTLSTSSVSMLSIPEGGSCTDAPDACQAGLSCLGPADDKKCFAFRTVTEDCDFTPYQVCAPGLQCASRRCRPIPVGEGSSCNPTFKCPRPLSCVGRNGRKRCFRKRQAGQKCGFNPFQVCRRGLICAARRCRPVPVGEGSACDKKSVKCPRPLSCVGRKGSRKCFRKRQVGQKCGFNPFQVCRKGLICAARRCRPVPSV